MAWLVLLRKALLPLAILLTLIIAGIVYCEEYYVDGNSGNDAGTGTYADPWRTITHSVSQASKTDTIYVDVIRDSFRELNSNVAEMQVEIDGEFSFDSEWEDAAHYQYWMSPISFHPADYAHIYVKNDMDYVYLMVDLVPDTTVDEACIEDEIFDCIRNNYYT